jgi:hypothetical protein
MCRHEEQRRDEKGKETKIRRAKEANKGRRNGREERNKEGKRKGINKEKE